MTDPSRYQREFDLMMQELEAEAKRRADLEQRNRLEDDGEVIQRDGGREQVDERAPRGGQEKAALQHLSRLMLKWTHYPRRSRLTDQWPFRRRVAAPATSRPDGKPGRLPILPGWPRGMGNWSQE